MAGICCGVVGEGETPAPIEPTSSRPLSRRSLDLLPLKYIANMAVPPAESSRKRQKLDLSDSPARECVNSVESSESSGSELKEELNTKKESAKHEEASSSSEVATLIPTEKNEVVEECPKYGVTSVCGRRRDMEDAVSVRPSFCQVQNGTNKDDQNDAPFHFFGVYDGHGCSHIWCELQTPHCDAVGSTAVVAVVTPEKIVVSNCGDSRAVLCRNGVAIPLSSDHKPDRPDELHRVQNAGGRVIYWDGPRVLGVLAMSRAIGDNYLKPYVISEPEVTVTDRSDEDECLILASDGLWDVVSNDTACGVVRMCLKAQKVPSPPGSPGRDVAASADGSDKACSDASILLTKLALARHSSDNVSVVVVDLRRDQRQQQS
ncbi:hypothetical protein PIB30_056970 [Stylosanthes scabra]|uniref:protein-serine/threonine phosphatase n=1 Tax=Stylosanthes scabra TaxID=79078 RepID=A0ABU6ZI97_9FABA|nr:hypothetical protein [Stylosanthes scabra]